MDRGNTAVKADLPGDIGDISSGDISFFISRPTDPAHFARHLPEIFLC
jgi:hypothetical protein